MTVARDLRCFQGECKKENISVCWSLDSLQYERMEALKNSFSSVCAERVHRATVQLRDFYHQGVWFWHVVLIQVRLSGMLRNPSENQNTKHIKCYHVEILYVTPPSAAIPDKNVFMNHIFYPYRRHEFMQKLLEF